MDARFFTCREMAVVLGLSTSRIRQLALAHRLGTKVHGLLRLFSRADYERLRETQATRRRYNKRGTTRPAPPRQPERALRPPGYPAEFSPDYWQ
jgi:hypothetical protein